MVISNIKLGILRKKLAVLRENRELSEGLGEVRSIGVLLDEADGLVLNELEKLRLDLKVKKEDFQILLCPYSGTKPENFEGILFSPTDINWRGEFRNVEVQQFIDRKYDVLLSFPRHEGRWIESLAGACDACLKVSRRDNRSPVYDLTISTEFEEIRIFLDELKKYIKILNRKKNE